MNDTEHAIEEAALENIIAGCIRAAMPPRYVITVSGWETVHRSCRGVHDGVKSTHRIIVTAPLVDEHMRGLALTPKAALRRALALWMPDDIRATYRADHVAVPVTIRWTGEDQWAEITTDYRRAVSLRG